MTDEEKTALVALEQILDLTEASAWWMLHNTVRDDVAAGKYSKVFEEAYAALVDRKLKGRA